MGCTPPALTRVAQAKALAALYSTPIIGHNEAKCRYCGRYGRARTQCEGCGAAVPETKTQFIGRDFVRLGLL